MLAATPVRRAAANNLLSRVQRLDPGVRKTAAKRCASTNPIPTPESDWAAIKWRISTSPTIDVAGNLCKFVRTVGFWWKTPSAISR